MTDKIKPTEAELQAWLDAVHFGSCCSDPLTDDVKISKTVLTDKKKSNDELVAKCHK